MRFAKWSFRLAGIYGILLLAPFYFLEKAIGAASVPIAHPEYFYGFVGTALAAQLLFLLISTDPWRYRPAMPIAVLGKLSFGIPAWTLWFEGRIGGGVTALGTVDLFLAGCFAASWFLIPGDRRHEPGRNETRR
jgi:hypothetical protein